MKTFRLLVLAMLLAGASLGAYADRININEADAASLAALNGIGPARAEAIVEHRRQHGPFRTVDALADVRGISQALVDRNRDRLALGDAAERQARSTPSD